MLSTRALEGAPNWIDLATPDLDGALAFYGALFGWRFHSLGPDAGGYGFLQSDGRTVAGAMPTGAGRELPGWTVYFRTEDAETTAQAAERAHGSVLLAPGEVMGLGRMAGLADSAGAVFRVWQPGEVEGLDAASEPGALCWVELHTPDVAAGAAFYHRVLGLETSATAFPDGMYTCVNPPGAGEDTVFGGVVRSLDDPADADTGAYWLPYFAVTDPDGVTERARQGGGTVLLPPVTVPGVGRMARLTDPYGARFAVIRGEPTQS
ncbi:VOC family protein [Streptomyces sp. NPDC091385]|uniref:VOC family protein n=1 Tax=Streptomyces sp. NPDC091385 TaxID=3365997 RepID=UPI003812E14E